ncbi:hypothetical protein [Pseudomonas moraviensis]|uniref:Uncharacterized protein n=1 Tax=Pseudomonas moraviensis R28-S TaxID=1395516 RepID=V8R7A2_9PSED|nr:hypothetical protein [Pseudomonas moraviensis]ETF08001.1 hypothetical protein PMO01_03140 [Pseudomonas moraviensis R28-S]
MKLKTLKPLYLGGQTLTEGRPFETIEQHGRELIQKGYAELDTSDDEPVVILENEAAPAAEALTSAALITAGPAEKASGPGKKKDK